MYVCLLIGVSSKLYVKVVHLPLGMLIFFLTYLDALEILK